MRKVEERDKKLEKQSLFFRALYSYVSLVLNSAFFLFFFGRRSALHSPFDR